MKALFRLMLFSFAVCIGMTVDGQVVTRKAKDSTANSATKYITYNSLVNGTASLTLTGIKAATGGGTVSGYAILQVATDTLPTVSTRVFEDYVYPGTTKRDTLFFTDVTTAQPHTFPFPERLPVNAARFKIVTSGTQKLYLYATHLQR